MTFLQKTSRNTVLLLTSLFLLAFAPNVKAQCNLDITSVTSTECTTGEFYVDVAINSESSNAGTFNLLIGVDVFTGQIYGQGTHTVGPISENNSGSYIASVYDPADDSCNDFFTFDVECTPICSLTPSNFAPINCETNEVYFIASIESEDTGSQGLTVMLNGENYGTYDYEVINYEFGPFPYFAGEDYNFEFIDNEIGASCVGTYTYPAFELENCEDYCFVNLDALEISDCTEDGEFFLNFQVSTTLNSPSTSFTAFLGSTEEEFGPFNYGQDVYTIGPFSADGTVDDYLIVRDASGVEFCGAHELLFSDPDCGLNIDCVIGITSLEVGECDENGEFMVDFQVSSENPASASFRVYINDDSWSYQFTYAGAETYSIGPFDATDGVTNLMIHDTSDEECADNTSFISPDCSSEDCGFNDLTLDYQGCNEEVGTMFLVNFNAVGTGDLGFDVFANGDFLSSYLYADMPVTINIPAQPGNFAVLNFCDNDNPGCCTQAFADVVNCDETGQCGLYMNGAQFTDCEDGSFNIFVPTISTDGVLSETFNAYINDEFVGNFPYDQEDWLFGPVTLDGETPLVLSILDSENETCPASLNFGTPNPCENTPDCQINIPFVEVGACDADGQFFVGFEMLPIEGEGTVEITGNGQNYGTYAYNLPFYNVGPFDGTETATYELIVTDTDNPDCVQILTFASANCNAEECNMSLTFDEYANCFGDNLFYVIVSVTNANVEEGSFTFIGNGEVYGSEEYGAGSYAVGPFLGNGDVTYELIAVDNMDETCSVELTFLGQDCFDEPECDLEISFVEIYECNEAAEFDFDFGVTGLEVGDQFYAQITGQSEVLFTFAEGTFTHGSVLGDGSNYGLTVYPAGQAECSVSVEIEAQNCLDNFPCGFENISTEYNGCSDDGAYFYTLDFTPINTTNDFFDLIINGETSFYTYADLPIEIVFPPSEEGTAGFTICDNDSPDCCQEIFIDLPECEPGTCNLNVTEYTLTDCDEIGNFYVNFSLESENTDSEVFYAFYNGTSYGPFEFGQSTYQIGPLDGFETAVFEIDILVESNADCFAQIVFDSANCGDIEDCSLDIPEFSLIDCDEDNQFYAFFTVAAINSDAATYEVTGNGENYGIFNYEEGFITIGPFDGNLDPVWELIVTDTENGDCSTSISFVSPGCDDVECNLDNIGAIELGPCNEEGQFYVDILMLAGSGGTGSFSVFGNGETYGTFEYGDDFYTVGPFDGDGVSGYELIAVDDEFESCTYTTEFTAQDCGIIPSCDFSGLEYELDCVDEEFYVNLFFNHTGEISESFNVLGNGINYGTFSYENENGTEQFTIGPLLANETQYEFIVYDGENEECTTGYLELGQVNTVDCTAENGEVCNLEVSDYFTTECNDEGQYFVNIFLTETSFGSTFQVFSEIATYGPFEYGLEGYIVGPFNSGGGDFNLELYDTGFDQCFDNISIDAVDCPISDCFIDNLEVATGECNDANTYAVTIDFVYNDVGGEFFNLIYGGEIIGTYETANLPVTIENFAGNAEVETLTVCMDDLEDCCMSIDFLTPQCEGLIIWPGDGNFDGITNNMDILNMGIAYGFTGPERITDNVSWDAQVALSWQENFASGLNYVHADADGDGEVTMADRDVVSVNYDLTHDEVTPFVELEPNDNSPALFVDIPDAFELQQGMEFNAPIIFGLESLPVDNVYGVAFTLRYDPEIIDPASIMLEYPISWLGFPETNLMTFEYHDIDAGEIDVAITKIDQNNVAGWGEIFNFIGIIDNIAGKTEIYIEIDNVSAILSNEERFAVNTPTEITTITSTNNVNELQGFELFPNPTNDIVRIKNETGLILEDIQISDLNGSVLRTVHGEDSFDLSDLPSGVYMAKIVFEGKTIYRRVVRM